MIAIIDYDIGNLAAISNMFSRLGVLSEITSDPERISTADKIVLPGNGAFDACVSALQATNLVPLLEQRVLRERVPLLGICVGAQMLGHSSEEGSECGLGWINMKVKRFPSLPGLKIPHMGWRIVKNPTAVDGHPLITGIGKESRYYFVHSYYMEPADPGDILLEAEYGIRFPAAVGSANIVGVQFHPEKSHRYGKELLERFARSM